MVALLQVCDSAISGCTELGAQERRRTPVVVVLSKVARWLAAAGCWTPETSLGGDRRCGLSWNCHRPLVSAVVQDAVIFAEHLHP
jgi:hypothetical protein